MIVDLFCGAGGWAAGMQLADISHAGTVGLDMDTDALTTHEAAGVPTMAADLQAAGPDIISGRVSGLIASPPCQDWSTAGNGKKGTAGLTHIVPEWVEHHRPEWVLCEQVRAVAPTWAAHADHYRDLGYETWTGLLDAASYGTPQRRVRAVLIATSNPHATAAPPPATHHPGGLFGAPLVSSSEALGVPASWTIDRRQQHDGVPARRVPCSEPAPTVTGQASRGQWLLGDGVEDIGMTVAQGAALQSFPSWWPWVGSKASQSQQVGNAVPPLLAAALLAQVFDPGAD